MEQISNQNMYSKIIEAMQSQHIMLPSASPGAGNRLSTLSAMTEPGRCGNVTLDERRRASRDDNILLPFVGSTQSGGKLLSWKRPTLKL